MERKQCSSCNSETLLWPKALIESWTMLYVLSDHVLWSSVNVSVISHVANDPVMFHGLQHFISVQEYPRVLARRTRSPSTIPFKCLMERSAQHIGERSVAFLMCSRTNRTYGTIGALDFPRIDASELGTLSGPSLICRTSATPSIVLESPLPIAFALPLAEEVSWSTLVRKCGGVD